MSVIIALIVAWLLLSVVAVFLAWEAGYEACRYDQHVASKPRTGYSKDMGR